MDQKLRETLLSAAERDGAVRDRLAADGSLFDGYHPEMEAVHEQNAAILTGILESHGWPGTELAGKDGSEAAWLIVQHAIGLPDFQRRCLALIEGAVRRGEAPAWQAAYLADRIRTLEGRPQLYGTQFDWDDQGLMSPQPIEDPDGIDARRAEIGLPPLAETTRNHRLRSEGEPRPGDLAERRREMQDWAAKVGWRRA
jgi:hypothetical protein